jgi:hypothetical protein
LDQERSALAFFELNTGHNLHYSAPQQTVAVLLELAKSPVVAMR